MCKERMYKTMCCKRSTSYSPQQWVPCEEPNRPACVINEPVVDEIDVREHTCKNCAPNLVLADTYYARDTTAHLSAEYERYPRDAIPLPDTLTARLPRKLPTADETNPAEEYFVPLISDNSDRPGCESVRSEHRTALSPFHSPAPSSTQETGVVYTEDKEEYPNTAEDSPANWPRMFDEAQHRFDLEYDDATRNLHRKAFEKKKETLRWSEGVQKKPT